MEFEFEGIDELVQQIEAMGQNAEGAKNEALDKSAEFLQEEVRTIAPIRAVGGGNLRAHIERSEVKDGEIEVYVDNQGKAYYGHMLEFGTSKMSAQPFMFPAFQRSTFGINKILADTLRLKLGLTL